MAKQIFSILHQAIHLLWKVAKKDGLTRCSMAYSLPEKARRYNQRKKYDTNRYKLLLIEYIESRAGAPNYSLIGTILNDIEPGRFCNESAPEESLKEWYNDQKKKALSESIANPS